jgi:hypothetical protein
MYGDDYFNRRLSFYFIYSALMLYLETSTLWKFSMSVESAICRFVRAGNTDISGMFGGLICFITKFPFHTIVLDSFSQWTRHSSSRTHHHLLISDIKVLF